MGLWQGATENTTVVQALLEDFGGARLNPKRRYLFVIDGAGGAARGDRAGIRRDGAVLQRCQIHKRRNVKEYLAKSAQGDTDRGICRVYAMICHADAKAELGKIFRQLERINPSAAHSLEEGLEETLTLHRLGVGTLLRQSLASSNPIESLLFYRRKSAI